MIVLRWLGEILDFLGGAGPVLFGIALLVVTPFVDRLLVRRKRLSFRVLYNSKIGVGPERLQDGPGLPDSGPKQLRQVARLLDRLSVVVIRLRNSGSYDIDPEDFHKPLSFTFGGRIVWNARISDASTQELRTELRESLRFFGHNGRSERDTLSTVRRSLSDRLGRLLRAAQDPAEPQWYGVRLDRLSMKRGQKAKLVVVLLEPAANDGEEITKGLRHEGKLRDNGLIKDEGEQRLLTLPRVSLTLAALLTLVLVLALAFTKQQDPTIACSSGDLHVKGSTVMMPVIEKIRDDYVEACGTDAHITTEATGSLEGVRAVRGNRGKPDEVIAFSDGRSVYHDELHTEQVAVVVYHVVVNSDVGLTTLSTEQLRNIHDGTWTDWSEVPGRKGGPLPIRIIGRGGGDSGTRVLFEQRVLGIPEGPLTSDDCKEANRVPQAPIVRCERDDNSKIVELIASLPGAIGYSDAQTIAPARRAGTIRALTLNGEAFDASDAEKLRYPFWTVEYVYAARPPDPGSLAAGFIAFVRSHPRAQAHLADSGFPRCDTSSGRLKLCDLR